MSVFVNLLVDSQGQSISELHVGSWIQFGILGVVHEDVPLCSVALSLEATHTRNILLLPDSDAFHAVREI